MPSEIFGDDFAYEIPDGKRLVRPHDTVEINRFLPEIVYASRILDRKVKAQIWSITSLPPLTKLQGEVKIEDQRLSGLQIDFILLDLI